VVIPERIRLMRLQDETVHKVQRDREFPQCIRAAAPSRTEGHFNLGPWEACGKQKAWKS
jgi:hypothetical protein